MKKLPIGIAFVLAIAFVSFQFTSAEKQVFKTNLRITVFDDLGNKLEGAEVTLYESNEDYLASENAVAGPEMTDKKGRVTFKDLEANVFYVQVTKGKLNNNGMGVKTGELEAKKLNKVNIVIQ
jgi:hypothetical protein